MPLKIRITALKRNEELNEIADRWRMEIESLGFIETREGTMQVTTTEQAFYEEDIVERECVVQECAQNSSLNCRQKSPTQLAYMLAKNWCINQKENERLEVISNDSFIALPLQVHENKRLLFLEFGTTLKGDDFYPCSSSKQMQMLNPKATFEHDYRRLQVDFTLLDQMNRSSVSSRFTIDYKGIHSVVFDFTATSAVATYFRFKYPPSFFSEPSNMFGQRNCSNGEKFSRSKLSTSYSNCNAFKMVFDISDYGDGLCETSLWELVSRLRNRSEVHIYFMPVQSKSPPHNAVSPLVLSEFPFSIYWMLKALLSRGDFVAHQLSDEFLSHLRHASNKFSSAVVEQILETLLAAVDEHRNISLLNAFLMISKEHETKVFTDVPSGYVRIRKMIITPSLRLLMAPEISKSNRILHELGEDYALRVVVRDDSGRRIGGYCLDESALKELVAPIIIDGYKIGDRHYKFLGWSNSQLRDHGFYLCSNIDSDFLRRKMGDFSNVTNVAKYMSKFALCFTQAQRTFDVSKLNCFVENDYSVKDSMTGKEYIFSDGIGRISSHLAHQVCKSISARHSPCAFQIRFAGSKGMVVVDPAISVKEERQLIFRKSMVKFEGFSISLEIVKASCPNTVCLNRPFVMILDEVSKKQNQNGITHPRVCTTIHTFLDRMLISMANMLVDEKESVKALKHRTTLNIDVKKIKESGFMLTKEPFCRGLLIAKHQYALNGLMIKCDIEIPSTHGRTMFGVLDEKGLLQYGEVFVQYSETIEQPGHNVISCRGQILVTKNPSHVPGDVRLFKAVYVEGLQHLIDVIVFPRRGPRPHPDEMAGSDLDGDEYSVFWDTPLAFDYNETPASYDKHSPPISNAPIQQHHIAEYFSKYVMEDNIGPLSTAHLVLADRLGLYHEQCAVIAKQCSVAVDFPKTGVPAEKCKYRIPKYPDYMQKTDKPMYKSHKLLGQLHRKIKVVADIAQLCSTEEARIEYVDEDLILSGQDRFENEAVRLYEMYVAKLQSLMDQYGIRNEFQLISGFIVFMKNRICDQERENFSVFDTERIIKMRLGKIFDFIRNEFALEFGDSYEKLNINDFSIRLKASMCYSVAYRTKDFGLKTSIVSFPWLFSNILCAIKVSRPISNNRVEQTIYQKLTETINVRVPMDGSTALERFTQVIVRFMKPYIDVFPTRFDEKLNELLKHFLKINDYPSTQLANNVGKYVMRFVQFLASQDFMTFDGFHLSNQKRQMLNEMAFKSFHHISYTSTFQTLNLSNEGCCEKDWAIGEFGPVVIEIKERNEYGAQTSDNSNQRFYEIFTNYMKTKSGMSEIRMRVIGKFGGFIRFAVVGVGTLSQRNGLMDILSEEWETGLNSFINA